MEEGKSWETFNATCAIIKQSTDQVIRTAEENRPRSYNSSNSANSNLRSLLDNDKFNKESNASENENKEEHSISSKVKSYWQSDEQFICYIA